MDKSNTAIGLALMSLLMSLGLQVSDMTSINNELENRYYCNITQDIQEFIGGISSSAYTGYPYENSRKGAIRCGTTDNKGQWINLLDYAKDNDLDPYDLLTTKDSNTIPISTKPSTGTLQYTCNNLGCKIKE